MHLNRIQKVVCQMKLAGVQQLLICSPASLFYLTGHWVLPGARFLGLLLDDQGQCTYFANELFYLSADIDCTVVRYADQDNPMSILRKTLADRGVIGIDNSIAANFLLELLHSLRHANVVGATECVNMVRMIKDAAEIELMRRSSHINDLTMADVISKISPERSEIELAHLLPELYCAHGGDGYKVVPIVSYGANCADPHHHPDDTCLVPGDSIVIDMGIPYKSYCSDMTRTVFYKHVPDKWVRIYEIVKKAQAEAVAAVRPGVLCCDIDKIARDIIEAEGYGEFFIHRTGHNIGIEGHEFPYINASSKLPLQEGMVFSVEPGIYLPNEAGVRIEDLVVVTSSGFEVINHYTKDLQIVDTPAL